MVSDRVIYDNRPYYTLAKASELTGYNAEHIRRLIKEKKVGGIDVFGVSAVDYGSLLNHLRSPNNFGPRR